MCKYVQHFSYLWSGDPPNCFVQVYTQNNILVVASTSTISKINHSLSHARPRRDTCCMPLEHVAGVPLNYKYALGM